MIEGWLFLPPNGEYRAAGPRIKVGKTVRVPGPPKLYGYGFQCSKAPIHALKYAPGFHVARVILDGETVQDEERVGATELTALWMADARLAVLSFGAWAATGAVLGMVCRGWAVAPETADGVATLTDYVSGRVPRETLHEARLRAQWAADRAAGPATEDPRAPLAHLALADVADTVAAALDAADTSDPIFAGDAIASAAAYACASYAAYAADGLPGHAVGYAKDALNADLEGRLWQLAPASPAVQIAS